MFKIRKLNQKTKNIKHTLIKLKYSLNIKFSNINKISKWLMNRKLINR